ncbi:peroxidase 72, partial [Quercus suber]
MSQLSSFLLVLALCAFAPLCFSSKTKAQEIVRSVLAKAVAKEARMAASILRLHFHDCFVQGCDASLLLDSSGSIVSEKGSNPNRNSVRGFEVLDEIKSALEKECPRTVSCADLLAIAARESTVLRGGPSWEVLLGRRDSRSASLSGSNNNIPAPNNTFQTILTKFKRQGLDIVDLVALSGSHTIGNARCTSFRQRLYNQSGNGQPDYTLDQSYAAQLKTRCPKSGGDQNLFFLDYVSPTKFDNYYYNNILASKGLLNSDQVLLTKNEGSKELVKQYAENSQLFFEQFAKSMVKMGNISPLTEPCVRKKRETIMSQLTSFLLVLSLCAFAPLCFSSKTKGGYLYPQFYDHSCPKVQEIVRSVLAKAVAKEARMAASILRLHFHDCFVQGCDASLLLDSSGSIVSEKGSNPNRNSVRGFEVLDEIKSALEKECPWSHTIGNARCTNFRQRLYNQSGNGQPDYTLDQSYAAQLKIRCPKSGGDQNLPSEPDQVLLTKNEGSRELVKKYAENSQLFFEQFAKSMVKMGNISPLTGSRGEIRKNCRK